MNKYDYILLTNIPAFYKVRLWNEIARYKKVLMIFHASNDPTRNPDFISVKCHFDTITMSGGVIKRAISILRLLRLSNYEKLIFSGWDDPAALILSVLEPTEKNAIIVESTIFEHKHTVLKDMLKRWMLKHISFAYVPGKPHEQLLRLLGFNSRVITTGGCGLLNYITQPKYERREVIKNFLFVGRLVPVKNLNLLINAFNRLPDLNLTIVGFGELETELKQMANDNIFFTGGIDNALLPELYQRHDVFILCSYSETWGLVVEEALNNGLPVIVSDHVGCRMDLVSEYNGLVFPHENLEALISCITTMTNASYYNELRDNISKMNFLLRAEKQINSFIS